MKKNKWQSVDIQLHRCSQWQIKRFYSKLMKYILTCYFFYYPELYLLFIRINKLKITVIFLTSSALLFPKSKNLLFSSSSAVFSFSLLRVSVMASICCFRWLASCSLYAYNHIHRNLRFNNTGLLQYRHFEPYNMRTCSCESVPWSVWTPPGSPRSPESFVSERGSVLPVHWASSAVVEALWSTTLAPPTGAQWQISTSRWAVQDKKWVRHVMS